MSSYTHSSATLLMPFFFSRLHYVADNYFHVFFNHALYDRYHTKVCSFAATPKENGEKVEWRHFSPKMLIP